MEEWIAVKIRVNNDIRDAVDEGRRGDAERVVREFMLKLEEGGPWYGLLSRIAFFMDLIYYIDKARAPSVDAGIYRYLYGIPKTE